MFDYRQVQLFTLQDAAKNSLVTTACTKKQPCNYRLHRKTAFQQQDVSKTCRYVNKAFGY